MLPKEVHVQEEMEGPYSTPEQPRLNKTPLNNYFFIV
jgi:hypothetical protein